MFKLLLLTKGYCKNTYCQAYKKDKPSIYGWGFRNNGIFNLLENGHECKCPLCGNYMQPISCGFYKTKWLVSDDKKKINPSKLSQIWKCIRGEKYQRFTKESQIVPQNEYFTVEVELLSKKNSSDSVSDYYDYVIE